MEQPAPTRATPSGRRIARAGVLGLAALALWGCSAETKMARADAGGTRLRIATFNVALERRGAGMLAAELASGRSPQAQKVAEILQRVRPDVVLLNEFDFDAEGRALQAFQAGFLGCGQGGAEPIVYPHTYAIVGNTGRDSGLDLDGDGVLGEPEDAHGFGRFPGQYAFVLLSRFPIERARTFESFLWRDLVPPRWPDDPQTPAVGDGWPAAAKDVVRLSSKAHVDLSLRVADQLVHVLLSHPTPPVFDGPEDRNGRRNADEIRFWAEYIRPKSSVRFVDDEGAVGGLEPGARFVILGDLNADPFDGEAYPGAIDQLLRHELIDASFAPRSEGGVAAARRDARANRTHRGDPALDTADFDDRNGPGNLHVDYVLPSKGFAIQGGGVFWPAPNDPLARLVGDGTSIVSSDHRLVWLDLAL